MKRFEGIDLNRDVDEVFLEVGIDKESNIIWMERVYSMPNRTYLVEDDFKPIFNNFNLKCLPLGQLREEEILKEGLAGGKFFKFFISAFQFDSVKDNFKPKNADRLKHRGIIYEVEKIKTFQYTERDNYFVIYGKESPIGIQDEIYREKVDPYFEYDASQEITSTNDKFDNSNLFVDYPVEIEIKGDFPILVWEVDNGFLYKTETMEEPVRYEIPAGTYTIEEFADVFKPEGLKIVKRENKYYIQTISLGKKAELDVLIDDETIYDLIGVSVGLYKGKEVLKI